MKHIFSTSFLLFVLSSCLIISCNRNAGKLVITDRNFKEEINQSENLVFTFNEDLVPDSLLYTWDTTEFMQFEPAVKGKYQWTSPNVLVFSPMQPFAPSTEFKAQLSERVLQNRLKKDLTLDPKSTNIHFHTPYLSVDNFTANWQKSSSNQNKAVIGIDLLFNTEVNPKNLSEHLAVSIDGKKVAYNILSTTPATRLALQIADVSFKDAENKIAIAINQGLPVVNSTWTTKKEMATETVLVPPSSVEVLGIQADHNGDGGTVFVNLSQQVEPENIKSLIEISPKVDFDIENASNGFTIASKDFAPGNIYKLNIAKGLRGVFKGRMDSDYESPISFGKLKPNIEFVEKKASYLSTKGYKNIAVKINGVDKVSVKISKVFENNIMSFMENGMQWGYDYSENGDYGYTDYQYYDADRFGTLISEQEFPVKKLAKSGSGSLLNLNFEDKLPQFEGIYVIEVRDKERNFVTDSKIVSYSDIGLIAKQEPDRILVFANSINKATPIGGVAVSLISSNNQKVLSATSNQDGVAVFENLKKQIPDFTIAMLTVQQGSDFNYLLLNQAAVATERYEVGGRMSNAAKYEAFIYGDRDIYRPGETIYLSTLVRNTNWQSPGRIPINLKMMLPNGKEYQTIRKTLNDEGATETAINLPHNIVTGTYTIEVYAANDVLLNSKSINIEEFMPDRIRVDVKIDKTAAQVPDKVTLSGTATNLFGPPASDRNYEVEMSMKREPFSPKKFESYTFETNTNKEIGNKINEGKTDAAGKFSTVFDIPEEYKDMGLLKGRMFVTVFDESGRPVNRVSRFDIFTQKVFYGIGQFDEYVNTRTPLDIPLIALDKDGKVINGDVDLSIIRYNWRTVLETTGDNGGYRYTSQRETITEVDKKRISINGTNTKFAYIPSQSGEFEVRISQPGTEAYVQKSFYAYGYGDTQTTSFEVNREGNIEMQFDKDKYKVGDKAKVLLTTPFEGKILVSLERDHIIKHFYVQTDKKAKEITIDVTKDMIPNIFVSATLIRPMNNAQIPLTVAHGYAPMMVANATDSIGVKITAPESVRSQTKQKIRVQTIPNAEVAIAVVDEGILQLKNYKTPQPYNFFYQKRGLEVNSYDLYPFLFPEIMSGGLLTGGGDAYDLGKRVNPITNKRIELVSYWSGLLKANSSGIVEYEVNIPQFSGELRVMAVAYKGSQFGSGETPMKVADPIVVSTGLPRFSSPGDSLLVPVTFANTTNKAASGKVTITTEGGLTVAGSNNTTLNIPANSEARATFTVVAKNAVGEGKVKTAITALGETFTEQLNISIRPPASLQKESGSGTLEAGKTEALAMGSNYIPESIDGDLLISSSPMTEFAGDLDYLIQYPYGCVEQTVSAAFPQVYLYDIAKSMGKDLKTATLKNSNNPNYNVQEAVRKIEGMQLYTGGLSYWQGGEEESWWGSVYALHFLYEAKRAGFEVKDKVLTDLSDYVQKRLAKKENFVYRFRNAAGKEQKREVAKKEIPYSLYVLSLMGKPQISMMNYYKSNPALLSLDGRYLLAASYGMAGDKTRFAQIVPAAYSGEQAMPAFDDSFYSPLRDEALSLYGLLDSDPQNQQIGIITKHLIQSYKATRWHSTQEAAFTLLAMGKLAKRDNAAGTATATVTAGGKTVGKFDGKNNLSLSWKDLKAGKVNITAAGKGKLYYFWKAEGLTANGTFKEEDNFLKIRRSYFDRFGRPLAGNTLQQNDMVVVKLSLQTTGAANVPNVVVTDMLPAGLEVENPRIGDMPDMTWIKDATTPEHQDFRDDRVNLFTYATSAPKNFYYVTRAVSPGTFVLGPVSADAMYNGEYHSYNGGGIVKITKRN
jgi:hypothetical protein